MGSMRYDRLLDEEILELWRKININLPQEKQITKVQASRLYAKLKCIPHTLVIQLNGRKNSNEIKDAFAVAMLPGEMPVKKKRAFFDILNSDFRV